MNAPHVHRGPTRQALNAIHDARINLALWERALPGPVAADIAALPVEGFPRAYLVTSAPARAIRRAFKERAEELGLPYPAALADEVVCLVHLYRRISRAAQVFVRIERHIYSETGFFHVDGSSLRLLCTFRGVTTEWVANEHVDRTLIYGLNHSIQPAPHLIQRFDVGHVALVKGEKWQGNYLQALAHRVPRVLEPHEQRMSIVIDDAQYAPSLDTYE